LPFAVSGALNAASSLKDVRDNEKDVLEAELVAAIDEFEEDARLAFAIYSGMHDLSPDDRAREAIHQVVRAVRALGETLIRQDRQWLDEGPVAFSRPGSWGTEFEPASQQAP
jgi:hypothetical protein